MTKRIPKRVLAHILDTPWAITSESLQTIVGIVQRENDLEAVAAKLGRPLDYTHAATVRDGVATIPIEGPLVRRADLFSQVSGMTSYDDIAQDLQSAVDNPAVHAILLAIDSPGGEVTGMEETAAQIRAASAKKPVVAHVEGMGASAAYLLAAAAPDVVASQMAILGSIGVRTTFTDRSAQETSKGIKRYDVVSSQSPGKASDPSTPEGMARIQALVDALAQSFIGQVAEYRGVSAEEVMQNFGGGDVLVGADAVKAGLADRLGSYESVHAELAARTTRARPGGYRAETPTTEPDMITKEEFAAANPDAVAAWRAEGRSAVEAEQSAAVATAVTAERERILALEGLPSKGHEALIAEAKKDPAVTAAIASQRILEAERDTRNRKLEGLKGAEAALAKTGLKASPGDESGDAPSARDHGRAIAQRFHAARATSTARS
ncbi:MAG TPA: S49 family peptidase [Gemmatimonadales bacterium]